MPSKFALLRHTAPPSEGKQSIVMSYKFLELLALQAAASENNRHLLNNYCQNGKGTAVYSIEVAE